MTRGIHPDTQSVTSHDTSDQPVLLIATCRGARCAGVQRLACGSATDDAAGWDDSLRGAVRERRGAVLVSLPCLDPCHLAGIAAVGRGHAEPNRLMWEEYPTAVGSLDTSDRIDALADWVRGSAPDPDTLPAQLRPLVLPSP